MTVVPTEVRTPKVSIIIPIYNTGKYLIPCLESAIDQSLREIEIICVNDGSTDGSLEVIKEFKKKDPRIVLVDKPNGGVSTARNTGLDIAKGEYIRFLDGDDRLPPDACEAMYQRSSKEKADILICGSEYVYPDGKRVQLNQFPDAAYDLDNINDRRVVFSKYLSLGTHNQFFRSGISGKVRYKPFSNGEDLLFFSEVLSRAHFVSTMGKTTYIYVQREDSASQSTRETGLKIFLQARRETIKVLENVDKIEQVQDVINRKILAFAIGDFLSLLQAGKRSEAGFKDLFLQWSSCYREPICKPHKRTYSGEDIARLVFRINSFRLYSIFSKMIEIYLRLKLGSTN